MTHALASWMRHGSLASLVGVLAMPPLALAAPLPIAQVPAGTAARLPAPNVIVSVDDSGSMGTAGMATLKAALRDTFSAENVPDGAIRLAWLSMNTCRQIATGTAAPAGCGAFNGMRPLAGTHRANFLDWVDHVLPDLPPDTYLSPSHHMLREAGEYLRTTGPFSPWRSQPGAGADGTELACRRAYNIFMTDGAWNTSTGNAMDDGDGIAVGGGNADGSARTLPDGTAYDPASDQTRVYRDDWGGSALSTLSDLAFHYWATDLQPGIADRVPGRTTQPASETIGATTLAPYWNPRNDAATWQHMSTYAIGFNPLATDWAQDPAWTGDTHGGAGYEALVDGTRTWPNPLCGRNRGCTYPDEWGSRDAQRGSELWHMALNGRGRFIPAPTADRLAPAFQEILGDILADNAAPVSSTTAAATSVARAGTQAFTAGYEARRWKGAVAASSIAQGSGSATANAAWGGQTTADKLDALTDPDSRLILSWREGSASAAHPDGATVFRWAEDESRLSTLQKRALSGATGSDAEGEARLNHLRGDRSREGGGSPRLRERDSRQGDIVNSRIWYVARPVAGHGFDQYARFADTHRNRLPMLYVGGNDGMLHGFSAADGSERIAYVPKGAIPALRSLTQPGYDHAHRYFVDGSPFSGDVNWGSASVPDWRTLLVGTLGAGGKGYFVLDVTRPGHTGPSGVASQFEEGRAGDLVVLDRTTPPGADDVTDLDAGPYIGQITAPPVVQDSNPHHATQIARLNDGKWALVMGNGYNSSREQPALLIQYLDGRDRSLRAIPVHPDAAGDGNGLSAPRLVDLDGDGKVDVVYAGDLKGHLWKFELLDTDPGRWRVAAFGTGQPTPLYSAQAGGTLQPITAAPAVRANARGATGLMVAFGTGRNLTLADRGSQAQQTVYAVLDTARYRRGTDGQLAIEAAGTALGSDTAKLVEQMVTQRHDSDGRGYDTLSAHDVAYRDEDPGRAERGWYFHFPVDGERLLEPLGFYAGTDLLEVLSEIPASGGDTPEEVCTPQARGARHFRTFLHVMDGKPPTFQLIDLNADGWFNGDDLGVSRMEATPGPAFDNVDCSKPGCRGQVNKRGSDELRPPPRVPLRPSWRQLP